jgi:phospholipid/cholesterol/gamma-HCH transport system substrate-binding protein
MIRRRLGLFLGIGAVVAALVVVIAGQGVNPANTLPRLVSGTSGGKVIHVDFVSAVNLPLGARVLSRGAQVGTLEDIELVPDAARLTLSLAPEAQVPKGSRAELRQTTILGDIYVALVPPAEQTSVYLEDGDSIPLSDTDPGPQIEDIITNLADFMAAGSIMRVQDAIREVNASVDVPGGDLAGASRVGAETIADLAAGTNELDAMIASLQRSTTSIASDSASLGKAFGTEGQFGIGAVFGAVDGGFKLIAGVDNLNAGLMWLVPRLAQLNPFLDRLVPILRSYSESSTELAGNGGKLVGLYNNQLAPFAANGAVALDRVSVGDSDTTRSVTSVLRMMGALR